ncbi:unnamed protein product [Caenorhabditis bovis]|uniref:Uncharacterized protein n=1 Tax=Caenorhabditis bovis TaxID=2654633 RepID=A0A8S1F9R1_9PELO|nr:unnamed protein product [Caenorhabditis bovis]
MRIVSVVMRFLSWASSLSRRCRFSANAFATPPLVKAMWIRCRNPYNVCAFLIGINVILMIFRAIFIREPQTDARAARECFHKHTNTFESEDQFFKRLWPTLHEVVDKCATKYFRHRIINFGWTPETTISWLKWNLDLPEHNCNVVFVHNMSHVELEVWFKREYPKCKMYSVSPNHEDTIRYKNPEFSPIKMKHRLNPQARSINWGGEHYSRDADSLDLVYLLHVQIHKMRYDALNIFVDGNSHIKSLFTRSPFDDANLAACQVNVFYDRPKTRLERREFRSTWKRLLYDRRYLVASVHRANNGNQLRFFILNISDPYCWAKYVSNLPFLTKNI